MTVVVTLALTAGILALLPMPTYPVPTVALEVTPSPERSSRGKRLVSMLCSRCHYDVGTGSLSGRELSETITGLGTLRAPNITRDPDHGIGEWTDGELALLLRTGLHPRLETVVPPSVMPRWPRMAEDDLHAVIAFLRSEDPWVAPHPEQPEPTDYSLVAKARALLTWSPLSYPRDPIPSPPRDDLEAFGRYLVDDLLQCSSCHSGDGEEVERSARHETEDYLGGGMVANDINGVVLFAANLSPHPTGIREWTSEDMQRALVDGFGPDGELVRWPMPRYPALESHEVESIYAYLQTVPPVDNEVEPTLRYKLVGRKAAGGRHQYLSHGCHLCHGDAGHTVIADLRDASELFPTDAELIAFIEDPRREDPFAIMPSYRGVIAEDEYAELCAYVRELARAPQP